MKKTIILIFIMIFNLNVFSQEIDKKYYASILFIQTNEQVKDSIELFLKENKMLKKRQKFTCNSFGISEEINFIDINPFIGKLNSESSVNKDLLNNYRKKYLFDSYTLPELKELSASNNTRLKLFFSRPIENMLIAEFVYMMNMEGNYKTNTMFGKGYRLIFIFDGNNNISKALYSSIIYN